MGKKFEADKEMMDFLSMEREAKKKKKKFRAHCTHTSKKGKTLLQPKGGQYQFVCQRCGTKIDLSSLGGENDELKDAVKTVRNALEVAKHRAARDADGSSKQIASSCASMILSINQVPDLINALLKNSHKKKKEKKAKRREITVGLQSLAFGGGKKKKNRW